MTVLKTSKIDFYNVNMCVILGTPVIPHPPRQNVNGGHLMKYVAKIVLLFHSNETLCEE